MKATFISFGFKGDGRAPPHDEFFDVRGVRNPYAVPALRELDGREDRVQAYVKDDRRAKEIMVLARMALKEGVRIAFGCYGGKHRSVAVAEMLAKELRLEGWAVTVQHMQLAVQDMAQA